jgi:hypothetical protein
VRGADIVELRPQRRELALRCRDGGVNAPEARSGFAGAGVRSDEKRLRAKGRSTERPFRFSTQDYAPGALQS